MKMSIKLNDLITTALTVCQATLDGLDAFEDKLRLVMKVVSLVLMKEEIEIESNGTRDLGEKLLAADVLARIKPVE